MSLDIPKTHRHLMDGPYFATMVTILPDGKPHATVVWRKYEDGHIIVAMSADTVKVRNMRQNPHVAFTIIDPQNPYHYLDIRGEVVELIDHASPGILDDISVLYTGQKYYGEFAPNDDPNDPLTVARIKPVRIRAN